MQTAKVTVMPIAPADTAEPFFVELRSDCGQCTRSEYVYANEKAVFFVPEGGYKLCVRSGAALSPGGQCKWIHALSGCAACYSAVFEKNRSEPTVTVRLFLQDAHYPNIIPLNGGITVMAAENRDITFVNGVAENVSLPIGTYTYVSNTIPGYENATMDSFTITADTQTLTLYITAAGTLTVSVVDEQGNAITDGELQLSNRDGTTTYGDPVDIDDGEAVFENVPYDTNMGIPVWISQDGSDTTHDPIAAPQAEILDSADDTATIVNDRKPVGIQATLTDSNYPNLTPISGTVTVNG